MIVYDKIACHLYSLEQFFNMYVVHVSEKVLEMQAFLKGIIYRGLNPPRVIKPSFKHVG